VAWNSEGPSLKRHESEFPQVHHVSGQENCDHSLWTILIMGVVSWGEEPGCDLINESASHAEGA
jgi:hypothetical protein